MKLAILSIFILAILATNVGASFLDDEAGMSAYAKASSIDLNKAKTAFRIIERQTSSYIIGSVEIQGLPETQDAHVYVNKDGWILSYYLKNDPVSKIMQWGGYTGGPVTTTKLADALKKVASYSGVSHSEIKYYNFKYPGSNRMMMIIDWLPGDGSDSYQFKIPSTYGLNENSWAYREGGCTGYGCTFNARINGDTIFTGDYGSYSGSGYNAHYGYYSALFSPNVFHEVSINAYRRGDTSINTILIYYEP